MPRIHRSGTIRHFSFFLPEMGDFWRADLAGGGPRSATHA